MHYHFSITTCPHLRTSILVAILATSLSQNGFLIPAHPPCRMAEVRPQSCLLTPFIFPCRASRALDEFGPRGVISLLLNGFVRSCILRGYSFGLTLTPWGALAFSVAKGQRGSERHRKRSLSPYPNPFTLASTRVGVSLLLPHHHDDHNHHHHHHHHHRA